MEEHDSRDFFNLELQAKCDLKPMVSAIYTFNRLSSELRPLSLPYPSSRSTTDAICWHKALVSCSVGPSTITRHCGWVPE